MVLLYRGGFFIFSIVESRTAAQENATSLLKNDFWVNLIDSLWARSYIPLIRFKQGKNLPVILLTSKKENRNER